MKRILTNNLNKDHVEFHESCRTMRMGPLDHPDPDTGSVSDTVIVESLDCSDNDIIDTYVLGTPSMKTGLMDYINVNFMDDYGISAEASYILAALLLGLSSLCMGLHVNAVSPWVYLPMLLIFTRCTKYEWHMYVLLPLVICLPQAGWLRYDTRLYKLAIVFFPVVFFLILDRRLFARLVTKGYRASCSFENGTVDSSVFWGLMAFPIIYSAYFELLEKLPFPFDCGSTLNIALSQVGTEIRHLASVGGLAIILILLTLFASLFSYVFVVVKMTLSTRKVPSDRESLGRPLFSATSVIPNSAESIDLRSLAGTMLGAGFRRLLFVFFVLLFIGPLIHLGRGTINYDYKFVKVACLPGGLENETVAKSVDMGANIILTGEYIFNEMYDAKNGTSMASKLSEEYSVIIGICYANTPLGETKRYDNLLDIYNEKGDLIARHKKFHPTPDEQLEKAPRNVTVIDKALETQSISNDFVVPTIVFQNPGKSESVNTDSVDERSDGVKVSFGESHEVATIGLSTCYDNYSPIAMSTAGRNAVQIMLTPSLIRPMLIPLHKSVTQFRAIENNYHVFTCARDGISFVGGPRGEVYSEYFTKQNATGPFIFELPVVNRDKHKFCVYPYIAPFLGWMLLIFGIFLHYFI